MTGESGVAYLAGRVAELEQIIPSAVVGCVVLTLDTGDVSAIGQVEFAGAGVDDIGDILQVNGCVGVAVNEAETAFFNGYANVGAVGGEGDVFVEVGAVNDGLIVVQPLKDGE